MYRLETFKRGVHMKLLTVEDDVLLCGFLEDALEREGHQVCGTAANVQRAVALARQHRPDVVILAGCGKTLPQIGCDLIL
jgi:chemotaxis response regulator CheB